MRMLAFSRRCTREIIRDPLNLTFGIGFPVILLLLLSAIQANIPVPLFEIESLTPGITVFSLSFMTLFSALILSRDRGTAFLQRLYTTPMTPVDFLLGYALPMIPIGLVQCGVCYALAMILGLEYTNGIFWAMAANLPVVIFYVSLGLLCGSVLGDKAVGGICGAGLTNVSAFLSGAWFDLDLVGGWFRDAAYLLPFVHATELGRAALACDFAGVAEHLPWVMGYALVTAIAAVWIFLRQMNRQ